MKQANLKELKCGDVVLDKFGVEVRFIGLTKADVAVIECCGLYTTKELFLKQTKQIRWVNLYEDEYHMHTTQKNADELASRTRERIGGKAFMIEYEE